MTSVKDRRAFVIIVAGSILTGPLAAEAQPAGQYRIGYLANGNQSTSRSYSDQTKHLAKTSSGRDLASLIDSKMCGDMRAV